jgi:hypothetical protein
MASPPLPFESPTDANRMPLLPPLPRLRTPPSAFSVIRDSPLPAPDHPVAPAAEGWFLDYAGDAPLAGFPRRLAVITGLPACRCAIGVYNPPRNLDPSGASRNRGGATRWAAGSIATLSSTASGYKSARPPLAPRPARPHSLGNPLPSLGGPAGAKFPTLVSRLHCFLEWSDGQWHMRDNNSLNGVLVNHVRRAAAALHSGDDITLGRAVNVPLGTKFVDDSTECGRAPLFRLRCYYSLLPDGSMRFKLYNKARHPELFSPQGSLATLEFLSDSPAPKRPALAPMFDAVAQQALLTLQQKEEELRVGCRSSAAGVGQ